ncbi:hypothetical protein F5Y03DRAFT_395635 [Xylaria venustula]|nr:hypothetical protein F5Y03DRAFT_395635 [Xylaria venustula]
MRIYGQQTSFSMHEKAFNCATSMPRPLYASLPVLEVGCLVVTTMRLDLKWVELHVIFCLAILGITGGCIILSTVQIQEGFWVRAVPKYAVRCMWRVYKRPGGYVDDREGGP